MRIISGKLGGRRINPPANMPYTRPTTNIAKEGLFNIIQNTWELEGAKTLDLFGGTGSISYELASRGASDLTIVEKDNQMHAFIKKTAEELKLENFKLVKSDVFHFIENCREQFDLIFAGPPYALQSIDELPRLVFEKDLLKGGGWFILEHTPRNNYEQFSFFNFARNYGTTIFSVFEKPDVD
jgi:16S rRNA (guanine(966)-N(2))-methyltransferase RsmD